MYTSLDLNICLPVFYIIVDNTFSYLGFVSFR